MSGPHDPTGQSVDVALARAKAALEESRRQTRDALALASEATKALRSAGQAIPAAVIGARLDAIAGGEAEPQPGTARLTSASGHGSGPQPGVGHGSSPLTRKRERTTAMAPLPAEPGPLPGSTSGTAFIPGTQVTLPTGSAALTTLQGGTPLAAPGSVVPPPALMTTAPVRPGGTVLVRQFARPLLVIAGTVIAIALAALAWPGPIGAEGSVQAEVQVELRAPVSGKIVHAAPGLRAGSTVQPGAPIVQVVSEDDEAAFAAARRNRDVRIAALASILEQSRGLAISIQAALHARIQVLSDSVAAQRTRVQKAEAALAGTRLAVAEAAAESAKAAAALASAAEQARMATEREAGWRQVGGTGVVSDDAMSQAVGRTRELRAAVDIATAEAQRAEARAKAVATTVDGAAAERAAVEIDLRSAAQQLTDLRAAHAITASLLWPAGTPDTPAAIDQLAGCLRSLSALGVADAIQPQKDQASALARDLAGARVLLGQADSDLATAEERVRRSTLGVALPMILVGDLPAPGSRVAAGDRIATLASQGNQMFVARVELTDLAAVQMHATGADVTCGDGSRAAGPIAAGEPVITEVKVGLETRRYALVKIALGDLRAPVGMLGRAEIRLSGELIVDRVLRRLRGW
jgi:hypothetical protein